MKYTLLFQQKQLFLFVLGGSRKVPPDFFRENPHPMLAGKLAQDERHICFNEKPSSSLVSRDVMIEVSSCLGFAFLVIFYFHPFLGAF